jgi:mono/diheme cytochrome c family protein
MKQVFIIFILFLGLWACDDKPKRRAVAASEQIEGSVIFRKNCVTCHGADGGLGMNGAANLSMSKITIEERIDVITNGRKLMQPWKSLLSEDEIKAVAEYTLKLSQ